MGSTSAGFLVNFGKSQLELVSDMTFLGFGVDLEGGKFYAPEKRWDRFQSCIRAAMEKGVGTARQLSRIAGLAISF